MKKYYITQDNTKQRHDSKYHDWSPTWECVQCWKFNVVGLNSNNIIILKKKINRKGYENSYLLKYFKFNSFTIVIAIFLYVENVER